jgi:hypothetical protein
MTDLPSISRASRQLRGHAAAGRLSIVEGTCFRHVAVSYPLYRSRYPENGYSDQRTRSSDRDLPYIRQLDPAQQRVHSIGLKARQSSNRSRFVRFDSTHFARIAGVERQFGGPPPFSPRV